MKHLNVWGKHFKLLRLSKTEYSNNLTKEILTC